MADPGFTVGGIDPVGGRRRLTLVHLQIQSGEAPVVTFGSANVGSWSGEVECRCVGVHVSMDKTAVDIPDPHIRPGYEPR